MAAPPKRDFRGSLNKEQQIEKTRKICNKEATHLAHS
jgi:hypothetical protein